MRTLYNLGRVTGLSQYELYIRQVLSADPTAVPLTEREWLCASIGNGNSMILKIPANTPAGYLDCYLPEGSTLCGCSTLQASLFEGAVSTGSNNWAIRVDSFGRLVENDGDVTPTTPGESQDVPTKEDPEEVPQSLIDQAIDYAKITSALMFQPGEWADNIDWDELLTEAGVNLTDEQYNNLLAPLKAWARGKSLRPDLAKRGFIRFAISDHIDHDLLILISGFMEKSVIAGFVGFEDFLDTSGAVNGNFLGPQIFPWATKVELLVSNEVLYAVNSKLIKENSQLASAISALDARVYNLEHPAPTPEPEPKPEPGE